VSPCPQSRFADIGSDLSGNDCPPASNLAMWAKLKNEPGTSVRPGKRYQENQGRLSMTTRRKLPEGRGRIRDRVLQLRHAGCRSWRNQDPLACRSRSTGKPRPDGGCACALLFPGSHQPDGRRRRQRCWPPVKGVPEHFIVVEQRLKEMDAMAIDMEVLSINPFWYGKDRDTAGPDRQAGRTRNWRSSVPARPERFAAFCLTDVAISGPCRAAAGEPRSGSRACEVLRSAPACWARTFPIRNSIRSGPRRKNSAQSCSFIRRARPELAKRFQGQWLAVEYHRQPRSTLRSPCNI